MNVYYLELSEKLDGIAGAEDLLSEQRRAYCAKMKAAVIRRQSAWAYLLLRYALSVEYGITGAPEFVLGEHGKPSLKDSDVFFSLSHIRTAAVCTVSREPVGCDVQDMREVSLGAAKKFCTAEELAEFDGLGEADRRRQLCRLWCVKESHSKMTGLGFSEGFHTYPAQELIDKKQAAVTTHKGCFVSVCGGGEITLREVNADDILQKLNKG